MAGLSRDGRPAVPGGAAFIAALSLLGGVGVLCCAGIGSSALQTSLEEDMASTASQLEARRLTRGREAAARTLLDDLAARLELAHHSRGEYPPSLSERPPEDPWGNRVRYERRSVNALRLTSAGGDGKFDTADDLILEKRAD